MVQPPIPMLSNVTRPIEEALSDYNIPVVPELVLHGAFQTNSGNQAVAALIDEYDKVPGRNFEVFVCSNDYMALGVLTELQTRGISVP